MTIIEFLRSLSWEMDMYEVLILWKVGNHCPICKKYYETEDDEYSCEGNTVDDYRYDGTNHLAGYPDVYETEIVACEIVIERGKITISHTKFEGERICPKCEEN